MFAGLITTQLSPNLQMNVLRDILWEKISLFLGGGYILVVDGCEVCKRPMPALTLKSAEGDYICGSNRTS